MRNVLFVHNGPLYRGPDGQVYGTHFTEAVKQRYLLLGDHVTLLMREAPLEGSADRFSHISSTDFDFVPVPNLLSPVGRITNHVSAMRVIAAAVANADLVVARIPSLTSRIAIAQAQRLRKPYLVECVACNWDALWNHGWKAKLSASYYFMMQKSVMARSTHAIYVTSEFLQRRYPTRGKHTAISNVELAVTPQTVLEQRLRRIRTGTSADSRLKLVTVANVAVPYKAQGDVISVLPEVVRAGVDAEYHLIGEGDPRRLQRLAQELEVGSRVVFHGAQPHDHVFELLDDMDVYLQPSKQEGLPRALIEAMSRGLPAAGARTGGIPELLDAGRIFHPGAKGEILPIIRTLTDPKHQEQDARRNFERASDFTEPLLNAARKAFYREFLRDHGLSTSSVDGAADHEVAA